MVFSYLFTLHLLGFGRSHPLPSLNHIPSTLIDCHLLEGEKKEPVLYSPVSLAPSVES